MHSWPVALLGQASGSAFPFLTSLPPDTDEDNTEVVYFDTLGSLSMVTRCTFWFSGLSGLWWDRSVVHLSDDPAWLSWRLPSRTPLCMELEYRGRGTWLYCGVHFKLTCVHRISGGFFAQHSVCPVLLLGASSTPSLPLPGISLQVFRWARFRLGVCFSRCALAVCVTLRLSGPWCPGWSCVNIMCWSYFLFVRLVVWGESKTAVLCCNCFWHCVPKLR